MKTSPIQLWALASRQADNIKKLKSQAAKSRQIALLCRTLVRAMKGGK